MGIKMTTPMSEIDGYINRKLDEFVEDTISNLEYAGEAAIADARTNGSYTDRTGNLRSSVGYVIVKDGEIVRKGGFDSGKPGAEEGARYAESLAGQYPQGIVLIVVAGMNYAAYVSAKGYNVLESAEMIVNKILFGLNENDTISTSLKKI